MPRGWMKNIGKRDAAADNAAPRASRLALKQRRGGGSRKGGGAKGAKGRAWRGAATWSGQAPRKKKRTRSGSSDTYTERSLEAAASPAPSPPPTAPQVKIARGRVKGGRGKMVVVGAETAGAAGGVCGAKHEEEEEKKKKKKKRQKRREVPARRAVMSIPLTELIGLSSRGSKAAVAAAAAVAPPLCDEKAPPAAAAAAAPKEEDSWVLVDTETRVSSNARVAASWKGVERSVQSRRSAEEETLVVDTGAGRETKGDSPEEAAGFLSYFFSS
jgi:hypothetical protein